MSIARLHYFYPFTVTTRGVAWHASSARIGFRSPLLVFRLTSIVKSSSGTANASRGSASTSRKSAIADADHALATVLSRLEQLCSKDDAEQLMGRLLRSFNAVTGLSGWSDPQQLH